MRTDHQTNSMAKIEGKKKSFNGLLMMNLNNSLLFCRLEMSPSNVITCFICKFLNFGSGERRKEKETRLSEKEEAMKRYFTDKKTNAQT